MKFIEKGLAGRNIDNISLLSGSEEFSKLNFQKIFHEGYFERDSDIKQFRHSEVVKEGGIPIADVIRGIACRSIAEKQTLLYLLKKTSIEKYNRYKNVISYKPEIDIFYNNGIFIREIKFEKGIFYIELNDNNRYNSSFSNEIKIDIKIYIHWLGKNSETLDVSEGSVIIDYRKVLRLTYKPENKVNSKYALLEIRFDDSLMYKNIIPTSEFELI